MAETEFRKLFEKTITNKICSGKQLTTGEIVGLNKDYVIVNAGLKSESYIPIKQFLSEDGSIEVNIGDVVEVVVEELEDGLGETRLSREKAKKIKAWDDLSVLLEQNKSVKGLVSAKVKGGFTVDIGLVKAFLPGSLVDIKPVRDNIELEGKELEFKIIKVDKEKNNVVVSRRSILEQDNIEERKALIENLDEGQIITGIVKNLVDYGAFVDLGGLDGLLHITDMAWKRVKHPSEVVAVGQEIEVKILKFDKEKTRVSLGLKQLQPDPWQEVIKEYPVGSKIVGKITNIADYGCFLEIANGVEGLVYVSELDWTNKNIHPSKVVQLGSEVEVMIIEIDEERRRISLSMKQCVANPWSTFSQHYNKGDKVKGKIKSITDFGIFIGLDGGIDALIHLSDLSWDEPGDQLIREYKKGQEVEAVILGIDVERERISLGIKQLSQDVFYNYIENNTKGAVVSGAIAVITNELITLNLAEGIEGYIKAGEFNKIYPNAKIGESVEAKIINIDRKNKVIQLSAKVTNDPKDSNLEDNGHISAKLGDILKEHLNNNKTIE